MSRKDYRPGDISGHVYESTEHFTHRELRLVRCNRRDLDRSWLRWVRPAENRSRHFRNEGQPPGEPSAQFRATTQPDVGSGTLVAPEFHSRSGAVRLGSLSFLAATLTAHGDTDTYTRCHRYSYVIIRINVVSSPMSISNSPPGSHPGN